MKLSISGKVQTLLRKLKSRPSRNPDQWFPRVLDDEYSSLWNAFLGCAAAKDVFRLYGVTSLGQYYLVALFLSYVSRYTKVPSLDMDELYDPLTGCKAVRRTLDSTNLLNKLSLKYHSHDFSLQANELDWLRCLVDIECSGVLTYKLSGRKPLDAYLGSLSPSVFRSVPVELRSDRPFGEAPIRKQKLVTPNLQLKSGYGWVSLPCDGAKIEIARAKYSTILLRYSFPVSGLFAYGSDKPTDFTRKLRRAHEKYALTLQ